jgi:serine/threonine protein kinase
VDRIVSGQGGSDAVVILKGGATPRVFKIMPRFRLLVHRGRGEPPFDDVDNEHAILKALTTRLLDGYVTPHFVRVIHSIECPRARARLLALCRGMQQNHDLQSHRDYAELADRFRVLELEYCPTSVAAHRKRHQRGFSRAFCDRLFFQLCYTLYATHLHFPGFHHMDLTNPHNLMGVLVTDGDENVNAYDRYIVSTTCMFDVPHKVFHLKIGDFGLSSLDSRVGFFNFRQPSARGLHPDAIDFYKCMMAMAPPRPRGRWTKTRAAGADGAAAGRRAARASWWRCCPWKTCPFPRPVTTSATLTTRSMVSASVCTTSSTLPPAAARAGCTASPSWPPMA